MFDVFPKTASEFVANAKDKIVKLGIDPTGPRLHLGHLVPIRVAIKLMKQGNKVRFIMGTFTAQLGDPSGVDKTRPSLTAKETNDNSHGLHSQLTRVIFQNVEAEKATFGVQKNSLWFDKWTASQLLELMAKFNVNELLSRDGFQKRILEGNSIGAHELIVPLLQGFDSVVLKADIEIGGSDQLFNFQITRKVQEIHQQNPEVCIMTPIINGTDGRKMSKSLGNCIFLDDKPEDIFGKCMSVSDQTMEEWIPLLCDKVEDLSEANRTNMNKKKWMAWNITRQIWGGDEATKGWQKFEEVIQNKNIPAEVPDIQATTLVEAIKKIRSCSGMEANRLLKSGAIKVNNNGKDVELTTPIEKGWVVKVGPRNFGRII